MKNVVVTGSIAYDHIMGFDGEFKDSILPHELENLSVSFLAGARDMNFGGCAPNIGFNLKMLGLNPLIFGVAGNDFDVYKEWLEESDISTEHIEVDKSAPTAAAYILNDKNQNQMAIFSPAAMNNMDLCMSLGGLDPDSVECAIITPDIPERMVAFAQECMDKDIPYIFDPGQAVTALSTEYLSMMIKCCLGLITNKYEADVLEERLRMPIPRIGERAGFLVKTLGEEGCQVYQENNNRHVPAISGVEAVDVTGCGDSFRAGFIYGMATGESMKRCCEMANVAASFTVDRMGTQNHRFTSDEFSNRLKENYGE